MTRSRIMTSVLVVVALVASLAVIVGCSSAPKTLEEYFKAHAKEWSQVQDEIKASGEGVLDVELTVKDNTITQIMTYKQTFSDEQLAQIKDYFETESAGMLDSLKTQIKQIEDETKIKGVTWEFVYNNGDGTPIFEMTATS